MPKPYILDLTATGETGINKLIGDGFTSSEQIAEIPVYKSFNKDKNDTGLNKDHIIHIAKALHKEHKLAPSKKVIFVYPANSVTAKLKPSERHNKGSSGLGGVFEMPGIDNAGIPTITQPGGSELASEAEIKHYIAQLYALAAQGHVLVIPKFSKRYAFGGGVSQNFVDSTQDKLLQKELKALEDFLASIEEKPEDEANGLITKLETPYAEAYQRGLLNKDKNPDDVFLAFGQKPVINTGNAGTFKFKDLQKIQNLCSSLQITMTKESEVKYKLKDNKNNEMILEPHRVSATKDENDVDFYLNMIKIAAANAGAGKQLHFFATEKEKDKIKQAIDQAAKLTPSIKVELVTDAAKFKEIEDAAKQALGGAPATPPSPPPPPAVDPFKDNLLVRIITGTVSGYEVKVGDIKSGFKITTPDNSGDLVNAFKELGLKEKEHFEPPVATDGDNKPYVKLKTEAIAALNDKYDSINPKSALLAQAINLLEHSTILDVKTLLNRESDQNKNNLLITLICKGGNSDRFELYDPASHKIHSAKDGLKICMKIEDGFTGDKANKQNELYETAKDSLAKLGLVENNDFQRIKAINDKTYDHILIKPSGIEKLKKINASQALIYICRLHDAAAILFSDDIEQKKQLLRDVIDGKHDLFGFHEKSDGSAEFYLKIKNYSSAELLNDGVLDGLLDFAGELFNGKKRADSEPEEFSRSGYATAQATWTTAEKSHAAIVSKDDLETLRSKLTPAARNTP